MLLFLGGYFLGSVLYEFVGLQCPFLIMTLLNLLSAALLAAVPNNVVNDSPESGLKIIRSLLKDIDIITGLG